ncbi:MAG: D-glycero-alpha-D-manno-heptose-1,7-bisphosphate 7-phosphatase [Saprospiraceae bacterium]|nr:D-glycero-alpha-D-manno-heptose-1,7-bisphosphate 7-phosphatase [Saprospiraceae bacterium]
MTHLPALFLDRDGVINERTPGDYVRTPEMFVPSEGMEEAMRLLSGYFGRIVVVTNQAGIGKGLMTEEDLRAVHQKMFDLVQEAGGRVDRVYHCPHTKDAGCRCRKPATGMAWQALVDFPDIDFANTWLVGDSASDIRLGQALGMHTALITGKTEEAEELASMKIDFQFDSLLHFARFIVEC